MKGGRIPWNLAQHIYRGKCPSWDPIVKIFLSLALKFAIIRIFLIFFKIFLTWAFAHGKIPPTWQGSVFLAIFHPGDFKLD